MTTKRLMHYATELWKPVLFYVMLMLMAYMSSSGIGPRERRVCWNCTTVEPF